jgi:menaquinone-9 beta-reductase
LRRGLSLEECVDSSALWLRRGFARDVTSRDITHWEIAEDGWLWIRSGSARSIWTSLSARKEVDMAARAGLAVSGMTWQQCRRWRRLRQAAGAGYFVCGDAAGYLDPASGDGLRFAIESGIRAGALAADVVRHPGRASLSAALYADWAEQDYRATKAVLQQVYARAGLDIRRH